MGGVQRQSFVLGEIPFIHPKLHFWAKAGVGGKKSFRGRNCWVSLSVTCTVTALGLCAEGKERWEGASCVLIYHKTTRGH